MTEITKTLLSGVFYTDGSCRPHNPGFIGWGVHGYFYTESVDKPVNADNFVHTNVGYIPNNQELSPESRYVKPVQYLDGLGSDTEILSNNVAEIKALYNLLVYLEPFSLETVSIFTDSEYLKTSMNDWCKRWEKNNWSRQDGSPVSNKEWLQKTYELIKQFKKKDVKISVEWIRSHNGHIGNERADLLASIGTNHSRQRKPITSLELSDARGYWKSDVDRNPYIAFRRLYFNSVQEYHRPGVYHLAESTDSDFVVGESSSSTGYSVVFLDEPDPVIEKVKKAQIDNSKGSNAIILMKLESVFHKQVHPWILRYGDCAMIGQRNTHSMTLVDRKPITLEMNPTGLSLRALDYFAMLEELLASYCSQEKLAVGASLVQTFDITDKFYQTTQDKKGKAKRELLPEFIVGFKNLMFDIDYLHKEKPITIKIPYILGYDCLPRNNLKHLESEEPTIKLLVWSESSVVRYATIIESKLGTGIWANYFANQIVIPG